MSVPRFHMPGCGPGARLVLPAHSAHHARNVLRLGAGMLVHVFDEGREWTAVLDEVSRSRVAVRVGSPVEPRPESPLRVCLAVSPLRGDRMELVVQKATELGVEELWPVVCERTDAAARPALKGARHERWEKVASGAAEQSGRARVPRLPATRSFAELLAEPPPGQKLVCVEHDGPPRLRSLPPPAGDRLAVLVGPPGGLSGAEQSRAEAAGFAPVSLGPRVLRTETAAIAALVAVQTLWGDIG